MRLDERMGLTDPKKMTRAAVIAALYVVLTILQTLPFPAFLTFGNVQLRISEGLTLLPLVEAAAVPGLFIGCLLANLILSFFSTYGWVDIIFGSLTTLVAAILTSRAKDRWVGMIPPVALNGIIVSIWVSYYAGIPYLFCVGTISLGEALAVGIFGPVFLAAYRRMTKIAG